MSWPIRLRQLGRAKPALAAALALLCALEWLLPGPADDAAPKRPAHGPTSAAIASDATITQWSAQVLARPLLSPSRRPAPVAQAAGADDPSFTLPRLAAIIVTGGTRNAVFAAPGQKPVLVAPGGEIGPYRVQTIAPDHVDMLGPDGTETLRPQFGPAGATPN